MARAHLLNKKRKSKPHSPGKKETAKSHAGEIREEASDLVHLQDQIGNQATQRLLAQRSGQGTLKLDAETAARWQHGSDSMVQALVKLPEGAASPLQRQVVEAIQRQEEAAEAPQAQPADGAVTIEAVNYDYYDVSGSTLAEVGAQLGSKEWGRCTYAYDYSYDATDGRTTKVDITLRLTIRLPRWQGQGWERASPAVQQEWQRMLKALEGHEVEHADLARKWAPVFKERLLNQKEKNLKGRYGQTLRAVNKETKAFDEKTKHGQTQGVGLDTSIQ